jgi:hypothetical protein
VVSSSSATPRSPVPERSSLLSCRTWESKSSLTSSGQTSRFSRYVASTTELSASANASRNLSLHRSNSEQRFLPNSLEGGFSDYIPGLLNDVQGISNIEDFQKSLTVGLPPLSFPFTSLAKVRPRQYAFKEAMTPWSIGWSNAFMLGTRKQYSYSGLHVEGFGDSLENCL